MKEPLRDETPLPRRYPDLLSCCQADGTLAAAEGRGNPRLIPAEVVEFLGAAAFAPVQEATAVIVSAMQQAYHKTGSTATHGVAVSVQDEGKRIASPPPSRVRQAANGFSPRRSQVANKLCRLIRVLLPVGLCVPPLILRATANGRIARSARLFVASTPACRTHWNSSVS